MLPDCSSVWPDSLKEEPVPPGVAPSLPPLKLYNVVKLVPSVPRAKIVPLSPLPPKVAVPYSIFPDKIKAVGLAPSLLKQEGQLAASGEKVYKTLKPLPLVLTA